MQMFEIALKLTTIAWQQGMLQPSGQGDMLTHDQPSSHLVKVPDCQAVITVITPPITVHVTLLGVVRERAVVYCVDDTCAVERGCLM